MNPNIKKVAPKGITQLTLTVFVAILWLSGTLVSIEYFNHSQDTMRTIKRFAIYGAIVIVLTSAAIYAGRWAFNIHVQREIREKLAMIKAVSPTTPRDAMLSGQGPRYALEIRALGLATENYFQDEVWNAIQDYKKTGIPILENELSENPRTEDDRSHVLQSAGESTFDHVGKEVVTDWPVPSFAAEPTIYWKDADSAGTAIGGRARDTGLAYTYFLWEDEINADDASPLIDKLFAFFDKNPEVPEAIIIASDADEVRCGLAPREKRCSHEVRDPDVLTSLVTLLVTRTDRVDRYIRPYARYEAKQATNAQQTQHDYIKQYRIYNTVEEEFNAQLQGPDFHAFATLRSDYWIAQLPRLLKIVGDKEDNRPVKSPYLPLRWMTWQLKTFDKAPLLGYLHRPVTIRLRDDDGKALKGETRTEALRSGWQTALASLPEGSLPERVFHDRTNDDGLRRDLSAVLLEQAKPIDLQNVDQGYDIGVRIGNTGISSPFVQIALATIAGYKTGSSAATVHRRADGDVTITMVSPPDAETKAKWEGESKRNPFTAHVPHG